MVHYLTLEQVQSIFQLPKKELKHIKVGAVFTLAEREVICIINDPAFSRSNLLQS